MSERGKEGGREGEVLTVVGKDVSDNQRVSQVLNNVELRTWHRVERICPRH